MRSALDFLTEFWLWRIELDCLEVKLQVGGWEALNLDGIGVYYW